MKTKRELQFLTYLDALEKGDADGISAFLALAEVDAELEKMMMDHHNEERPEERSKVITPLKRKREDVNQWWRRFGSGLIAALMMAVVGTAGIFIGAGGLNSAGITSDAVNVGNPENSAIANGTCRAEITSEDNTVTLLAEGDMERSAEVGVNNPFIVTLNTNRSSIGGGYTALMEGLVVTISRNSLNLLGDCSETRNLTVYPQDDAAKTCSILADNILLFPIKQYMMSMESLGKIPYDHNIVILDAPVDGNYPIRDNLFEGSVSGESIELSAGCTSFPLLYVQPYVPTPFQEPNAVDVPASIIVNSLRVSQQDFEHGTMFYLEAMQQTWVACEEGFYSSPWSAWSAWRSEPNANGIVASQENPPRGLYEPQAEFIGIWGMVTNPEFGSPICDLGWGMGRIVRESDAFSFVSLTRHDIYSLTNSSGQTFRFYETNEGEHYWEVGN